MSGEMMNFPDTAEEFMEQYKIVDREEVYTNGAELVPIFRMKQWLEQHPEPHWIPVTERLPEKFDYYLVSGINSVWFAQYESGRFLGILSGHALDTVIAWMPLPEPYKGVTE